MAPEVIGGTGTGDGENHIISKEVEFQQYNSKLSRISCSKSSLSSNDEISVKCTNPKYPELDHLYLLHATIGNGGFSKVKVATDLYTGNKVAIKIVDKKHVGTELPRIDLEIETLQPLNHPHICKLFSVISATTKIFMIMEYCPTDLYEYIVQQDAHLPVDESRRIFIQLASAVGYLHIRGIAHRDLKPENALLDRNHDIKLTDFGLCAVPGKNDINKPTLYTLCGSPAYCAPELLRGPPYIGSKVDVWSLGVILFVLLVKELPFYSKNVKELYKKIQEGHFIIPDWVSESAKDLIRLMLESNVNRRPSLHRLWSHPWIKEASFLADFSKQIIESKLEVEMEEKASSSSRPFFYPPRRITRVSFREQEQETIVTGHVHHKTYSSPIVLHNTIVPYIETSGIGDTGTLGEQPYNNNVDCDNKSNHAMPSTSESLEKYAHAVPPLSLPRKLIWIRHAFKRTKNAFKNCFPSFQCYKGQTRQDIGYHSEPLYNLYFHFK